MDDDISNYNKAAVFALGYLDEGHWRDMVRMTRDGTFDPGDVLEMMEEVDKAFHCDLIKQFKDRLFPPHYCPCCGQKVE